ncbi:caspase-3-like isoform X4 [Haliotis rufescens]|uniref:caspase-3-like isoform X4 n=1 Tax=Haliotis rufescens TaxID=6454 RepID=UPI00201EB600|nr:caspase-3-like isoform X4 [Haliotis rufescens]
MADDSEEPKFYSYQEEEKEPVPESNQYDLGHPDRGVALIVCNEIFVNNKPRAGAHLDVEYFKKTFQKLGFQDIRDKYNMTADGMLDWFAAVSREDHSERDCLAVAITSHGEKYTQVDPRRYNVSVERDIILGSQGAVYTEELVGMFSDQNCPSLIGKPRLFLLQACRGINLDDGVDLSRDLDVVDAVQILEPEYTVSPTPCFKDFCIVYATPPGFFAFRRPSEGSWFVKAFWDIVEKVDPSRVDFLRLVTLVIHQVAFSFQSSAVDPRIDGKKQSGCIYSMLTKDIYFTPKQEADELMSKP